MLFNSLDFAIFLPIVFTLYWLLNRKNIKYQNLLILVSSYVFYGWWDWRFLILIIFSTLVDYKVGLGIFRSKNERFRYFLLILSIVANIGLLGICKYYNFFVDNFVSAFSFFGQNINPSTLNIILPVGISFYTFQTLSYSIDIYRRKLTPTNNFIAFGAFVGFFPQLVAGPIERATNLLPQFLKRRHFIYKNTVDGARQILWGFFKKLVIADNSAKFVNIIFNDYSEFNGSTLVMGAVFFAFQIYGDFSGYSDIAIGTSRLFGFELKQNFAYPYFSRNIAEFWRKWHISLSTWFRDYLYIPLGGSKGGKFKTIRNILIVFIISGLWHGANWTFIVWGLLHAIFYIFVLLMKNNRKYLNIVAEGKIFPTIHEVIMIMITFGLTVFAWIFFRADNIGVAINYISGVFSLSLFSVPEITPTYLFYLIMFFILIEWIGKEQSHALERLGFSWPNILRRLFYVLVIGLILLFMSGSKEDFIYFQF